MSYTSGIISLINKYLPRTIFSATSRYNRDIRVIKYGNTTKLIVNGIVQSFNKNSSFAKHKVWGNMCKIVEENSDPKCILILGLGGGTLVHMLSKRYPNIHIFAVEIDGLIIELGERFFDLKSIQNLTIIEADAVDVVCNPSKYKLPLFDCIVLDTYIGGSRDEEEQTDKFMEKLCSLFTEVGLLVVNVIVYKNDKDAVMVNKTRLERYLNDLAYKIVKYRALADNYIFYGKVKKSVKKD